MVDREQDPGYQLGDVVDLNSIIPSDNGQNLAASGTKHITMMMVGLDEERREGKRPYYVPTDDKQFYKLHPPVEIDIYILFAATIGAYETSLRDISDVVSFFQSNPVFDATRYPALNASVADPDKKPWQLIERLSLRLHMMTFEQQNNLWGMLGRQYMPSALYKMSMLTVFETKSKDKVASVNTLSFAEN